MISLFSRGGAMGLNVSPLIVPADTTGVVARLTSGLPGTLTFSRLSGTSITVASNGEVTFTAGLAAAATRVLVARVQNGSGDAAERSFTFTGAVPAPVWTVAPTISGSTTVGSTLTANSGTITNGTVSARQWLRAGSPIAGATGSTYVLTGDDLGALISVTLTATGAGGSTDATTATVGPVTETAPETIPLVSIESNGAFADYDGTPPDPVLEVEFAVTRQGFDAAGSPLASVAHRSWITRRARQDYPDNTSYEASRVALAVPIYEDDVVTGVTNNSTRQYPKPVPQWAFPLLGQGVASAAALNAALEVTGISPYGVAAVEYSVTDGTTTITSTVAGSAMQASDHAGAAHIVGVWRPTFSGGDYASLIEGAGLTCNAKVYPKIGSAVAVRDSAARTLDDWRFSPRRLTKRTTATIYAYLTDAVANDTGAAVNADAATARTTPYRNIGAAMAALVTANGGKIDGCTIRIRSDATAAYNWGVMPVTARTQLLEPIYIEPDPLHVGRFTIGHPQFALNLNNAAAPTTTQYGAWFRGFAFNRTATRAWSVSGGRIMNVCYEDCELDHTGGNTGSGFGGHSSVRADLFTLNCDMVNMAGQTNLNNSTNYLYRLARNCRVECDQSPMACLAIFGNAIRGATTNSYDTNNLDRSGQVIAWNRYTELEGPGVLGVSGWNAPGLSIEGIAVFKNEIEFVGVSGDEVFLISKDYAYLSCNNMILAYNTVAAFGPYGRASGWYDDQGPNGANTVRTHVECWDIGNIWGWRGIKPGDTLESTPGRTGAFEVIHAVCAIGNVRTYKNNVNPLWLTDDAQNSPTYHGLRSITPTAFEVDEYAPLAFADWKATTAGPTAGVGGGDYRVGLASTAAGRLPWSLLPIDLAGTARPDADDAAGAFVPVSL